MILAEDIANFSFDSFHQAPADADMSLPNPLDYQAIRNTIATYCIALDTKNFALLREVFTHDVEAIYPIAGGHVRGVEKIAGAIEKRLKPITSHHALSTQTLSISASGKTASATTYFTGIHFGTGKWEGYEVTAWGKYVDSLVLTDARDEGVPGASGKWLICRREVGWTKRLGEEGVMEGG